MKRVLIVDDHAVVRAGLRQILRESGLGFTFGEAGCAQEALGRLRENEWDLVLMDISLPDKNGIELLKQAKNHWKRLPVLMLSTHPESQYALRALKAGAAGYMTKESAPEVLSQAVAKALRGERYISPVVAELLAERFDDDANSPPHLGLSDREYQVLCMIGGGRTVSEIGAALSLSVKTVSTYRRRILDKMKLKSNAELTHYVVQHGLTI